MNKFFKIVMKILAIFFLISNIGHLINGRFWPIGLVIMLVFAFLGWRSSKS